MKYIIILFCFLLFSCNGNNKKAISSVLECWEQREVLFPTNPTFTIQGKDTIDFPINSKFRVVSYIDSIGCTSCKLKLDEWKMFISHVDSLFEPYTVQFLFFFTPKNKNRNEIYRILSYNKFTYPICIDEFDSVNKINKFPSEMNFQTFLLDRSNKVIAIGNPVHNLKIKELYLKILSGEVPTLSDEELQTNIKWEQMSVDIGTFNRVQEQIIDFELSNIGKELLIIKGVTASCGCTTVEYSKEPLPSGKTLTLKVKYKADHPEYFNKTITVYCNAKGSPFTLKISGNAR